MARHPRGKIVVIVMICWNSLAGQQVCSLSGRFQNAKGHHCHLISLLRFVCAHLHPRSHAEHANVSYRTYCRIDTCYVRTCLHRQHLAFQLCATASMKEAVFLHPARPTHTHNKIGRHNSQLRMACAQGGGSVLSAGDRDSCDASAWLWCTCPRTASV